MCTGTPNRNDKSVVFKGGNLMQHNTRLKNEKRKPLWGRATFSVKKMKNLSPAISVMKRKVRFGLRANSFFIWRRGGGGFFFLILFCLDKIVVLLSPSSASINYDQIKTSCPLKHFTALFSCGHLYNSLRSEPLFFFLQPTLFCKANTDRVSYKQWSSYKLAAQNTADGTTHAYQ